MQENVIGEPIPKYLVNNYYYLIFNIYREKNASPLKSEHPRIFKWLSDTNGRLPKTFGFSFN